MAIRACSLQEIVELPQTCSCGSKEGYVRCSRIEEVTSGKLLMEVACRGCGKKSLIPDEMSEQLRKLSKGKFRPTFYYNPETDKIEHWSKPLTK